MTNSSKISSSNFLPAFYRTDANKKFLQATVDQLIQPGSVKKVSGHIGRQTSKSTIGSDIFLSSPTKERQNYQLEPSLVIKDTLNNTKFFKDYQDYINQLNVFGGNTLNHDRLNASEFYSWDPHVCWDKLVNFQNYYWLSNGPDVIRIVGDNQLSIISEFMVTVESEIDNNVYVFSTIGELGYVKNPLIQLYKGFTYTFKFNSVNNMFDIKTARGFDSEQYIDGVVIDYSQLTITFTVLNTAPSVLYYQNNNDIELGGAFSIHPISSSTYLNVETEILGKSSCTINNIVLSNGMKLSFSGNVTPLEYSNDNYYVEGVGVSIKLIPETSILPIPMVSNNEYTVGNMNNENKNILNITNTSQIQLGDLVTSVIDSFFDVNTVVIGIINSTTLKLSKPIIKSIPAMTSLTFVHDVNIDYVSFDTQGFDSNSFDGRTNINVTPEYLLINRASIDRNAWSRKNRWFHKTVIETSALVNNKSVNFDQTLRATRPIIEFEADIRLFNNGNKAIRDVDLIDTITTDIFSDIEGQVGYNIDGISLKHGHTILFTNDSDHLVNNKIYKVEFIDVLHESHMTTHTVQTAHTSNISEPNTKTLYFPNNTFTTLPYGATVSGTNIPVNSIIVSYTHSSITINNSLPLILSGVLITITIERSESIKQIHLEPIIEPQDLDTTTVLYGSRNQGNTYWFNSNNWILSQLKTKLNQAPLFYMVDSSNIEFNDTSVYAGSRFLGTKLFSYKIGSGTDDPVLGFPLTYRNIDNIGDIVFDFNIEVDSFEYKNQNSIVTQRINTGYLKKLDSYINGWTTNTLTYTQPGIRIYKNENIILTSDIETGHQYTIYNIDSTDFTLFGANKNAVGQTFISIKSGNSTDTGKVLRHDYNVDLLDIKPNKSDLSVFVNGNKLSQSNWELNDAIQYSFIRLVTALNPDDILVIKTNNQINSNGFYEIPVTIQNNPLNEPISSFTLGEVIDHVKTIVNNAQSFNGTYPGTSNLRDIGLVSSYGTKFIMNSTPPILSLYHITSENNIIHAIEKNKNDYARFKRNFMLVSESLGVILDPREHVDLILQEINKDTPLSAPYNLSDMVPYGGAIKTVFTVLDSSITSYPLTNSFTLDILSNKAVGVYINGSQLCHGRDYTFNSLGFIDIITTIEADDIIEVYEYDSTDGCFVPETPTKLGLWPKYEPIIYEDTSLVTPRMMIRGHDGSSILAYNDYRDNLILELELRIFNNIKINYDTSIFDIYNYLPRYNQTSKYSLFEVNSILTPEFYKWSTLTNKDYSKHYGFNNSNAITYNYTGFGALNGDPVPGYWCGIYNWLLDTTQPNLFPWECLGLTIKPAWWDAVYGPPPYTSDNLILWNDLANGIIKEPGKLPLKTKFVRPFLSNHCPVDENGNIKSPLESGLVIGSVTNKIQNDFIFGDMGPVEYAWRRSSYYPFSMIRTILLMNPSVFSILIDRSRVVRNLANQLVYSSTNKSITSKDIIIPSTSASTTRTQTSGLINYLINYLQRDNIISNYEFDLQNITCKLSYRVGGFTAKEKFNLILDSKSPNSSNNVFVPKENYDLILNSSSPVKKLSYSGVIITKLTNGFTVRGYNYTLPYFQYYQWTQSGSILNIGGISEVYSIWSENQQYIAGKIVNYNNQYYRVKTTHTSSSSFDQQFYQPLSSLPVSGGKEVIMRKRWNREYTITVPYNTMFRTIQEVVDFLLGYGEYLKDQGFVFDEFNTSYNQVQNWETGVKEFLFWTTQNWSTGQDKWDDWVPTKKIPYGSIVRYVGDYYQAVRESINIIPDSTEGEFYFIKMEGLSNIGSSVIAISPGATKLSFKTPLTVVDDIKNQFNDYDLVSVNGSPIPVNFLNSYHNDSIVSYSPRSDTGIYGGSFYLIQKEHVIILDNISVFNDIIYNTTTGYRQDSFKVHGYISTDWNGSFNIPGFIFDQAIIQDWNSWTDYSLGDVVKYKEFYYSANSFLPGVETFNTSNWYKLDKKPTPQLLPNWTHNASQFTTFYDLDSNGFDYNRQQLAQHLIGYQKREYLNNIIQDDISEFKFYQGMIGEKGTANVFNKLFDALNYNSSDSVTFNEEWALRVGRYGANNAYENIEFILDESLFKSNPQGFELVPQATQSDIVDFIIRQTPYDVYLKPNGYSSTPFPVLSNTNSYFRKGGHVKSEDVLFTMQSLENINDKDSSGNYLYPITSFNEGDYVWCTFVGIGWDVYKFTNTSIQVNNIVFNNNQLIITANDLVKLTIGSYIGLTFVIVSWSQNTQYQYNDKVMYNGILYLCQLDHTSNDFNTDLSMKYWIEYLHSGIGFYKVVSVDLNRFVVNALDQIFTFNSLNVNSILIYEFNSQRVESIDDANDVLNRNIKSNSLLWVDDHKWSTWINNSVYNEQDINIDKITNNLHLGNSIVMNVDGTILAVATGIGYVYVFDRAITDDTWVTRQLFKIKHESINSLDYSKFATIMAMSPIGDWLAIGSPSLSLDLLTNEHGFVDIYKRNDNNRYIYYTTLTGDVFDYEQFGSSLIITENMLFIGSKNSALSTEMGRVIMYAYNETWSKTEFDKIGSINTNFGSSLSINNSRIAIAEPGNAIINGIVHIYDIDSYNEIEIIDSIYESYDTIESFGRSVSLSMDSNYIAISSTLYDKNVFDQGIVYVYKLNDGTYNLFQVINPIDPNPFELFGEKLSFTNNDSTLVIYSKHGDLKIPWSLTDATTFDNGSTNLLIEVSKYNGRVDVYDRYESKWIYGETLRHEPKDSDLINNTNRYGNGFAVGNNTVVVGAPFSNYYNIINCGRVFCYNKPINAISWTQKNYEIDHVDLSKIKRAFIYNKTTSKLLTYLDVIDPLQGKIPGICNQEITYKTFYDPAIYTIGNSSLRVDASTAWTKDQVGKLWWDLTTAKFIESYDSNVVLRNSTWNSLVHGASIDIYEWVETIYPPSSWITIADTEEGLAKGISGTPVYTDSYSISQLYDNVSNTFINTYYYWVKNKKTIPIVDFRSLSAQTIANLIRNPRGEGYKFVSLTGTNSFSLCNVKSILDDTNVVLSLDYWVNDVTNKNIHTQWDIFDPETSKKIPKNIESKWFDSLCGKDTIGRPIPDTSLPLKIKYGIENRPRQGMFVNPLEALKEVIEFVNRVLIDYQVCSSRNLSNLESYDNIPNVVRGLYDQIIDTDASLNLVSIGSFRPPSITPIIINGSITGINIIDSGSNYLGNRVYDESSWYGPPINIIGSGVDANLFTKVNSLGEIIGVIINNPGMGYDSNTVCLVRSYSVLVRLDSSIDNLWSIYSYYPETQVWSRIKTQSYDTRRYWEYTDWYASGYSQFNAPDYTVNTYNNLNLISPKIGELVRISNSGSDTWTLLEKYNTVDSIDWTDQYKVVGLQNGTIQFLPSLYNYSAFSIGYDSSLYDDVPYDNLASFELRNILIALRDDILIDDLLHYYLKMFMTSLKYVLSEQLYVDWVFKTSFINTIHNVGSLDQQIIYQTENLEDYENYISEVKPYRTKVREYISKYEVNESALISVTDFDLPSTINNETIMVNIDNDELIINDDNVLSYPWKYWYDNVGMIVESIDIINGGSGYLFVPKIEIIGNCRVQAKATAYLSNSSVVNIIIDDPGEGYVSTPSVIINGHTDGIMATAIVKLGTGLAKTITTKMNIDRISRTYTTNQLLERESFISNGVRKQFQLKWAPDITIGKTTVTIGNAIISSEMYQLDIIKSSSRGFTSYYGSITFNNDIPINENILVEYHKNFLHLTAVDRIQFSYEPLVGEAGKELAQLMTGIDYGGVVIDGLDFNVSSSLNTTPYGTSIWGTSDQIYDDYIVMFTEGMTSIELPYVPEINTNMNVYMVHNISESFIGNGILKEFSVNNLIKNPQVSINTIAIAMGNFNLKGNTTLTINDISNIMVGDIVTVELDNCLTFNTKVEGIINSNIIKLDNMLYNNIPTGTSITFIKPLIHLIDYKMLTPTIIDLLYPVQSGSSLVIKGSLVPERIDDGSIYTDGLSSIIDISSFVSNISVGDQIIIRKSTSDGSILPFNYDSIISGGALNYETATGLSVDDLIIDGGNFTDASAPEEVIPGHVIDSFAIKVYSDNGSAYMQFKDMLNRVHYKRINSNKQTILTKELKITDYTIEVLNASNFNIPNPVINIPGIIEINGERIEYFTINGNILGQLRRSTLGTSAKLSYPIGTIVQDIGASETIPYSDTNEIYKSIIMGEKIINWNNINHYMLIGIILKSPNNIKYILKSSIDGIMYTELYQSSDIPVITAIESSHLSPGDGIYMVSYNGKLYSNLITDTGELESQYITYLDGVNPYYLEILPTSGSVVLISENNIGSAISVSDTGEIIINNGIIIDEYQGYMLPTTIVNNQYNNMITYSIIENNDIVELDFIPHRSSDWNIQEHRSLIGIMMRSLNNIKYILIIDDNGALQTQPLEYANGIAVITASIGEQIQPGDGFNLESNTGKVFNAYMSHGGIFQTSFVSVQTHERPFILELPNVNDGIILTTDNNVFYKITISDLGEIIVSLLSSVVDEVFYVVPSVIRNYGPCNEIEVFVGGYDIKPWTPNTEFFIDDYIILNNYTYKCLINHISSDEFYKDWNNWSYFVEKTRLFKSPYSVFNSNIAPYSPEGDVVFNADFMVDGVLPQIKLTNKLKAGTQVTVIRKTGVIWNSSIMNFINN